MSDKLSQFVIFAFIFLSVSSVGRTESSATGDIPKIKKDCSACHVDVSKGHTLNKPLSDLCLDCHPDRRSPNEHKVDTVPTMTVQKLPLSEGKITCATCHDPHSGRYGKMLRVRPKDLCMQCHNN